MKRIVTVALVVMTVVAMTATVVSALGHGPIWPENSVSATGKRIK